MFKKASISINTVTYNF